MGDRDRESEIKAKPKLRYPDIRRSKEGYLLGQRQKQPIFGVIPFVQLQNNT